MGYPFKYPTPKRIFWELYVVQENVVWAASLPEHTIAFLCGVLE
jgi:hypothetical protein